MIANAYTKPYFSTLDEVQTEKETMTNGFKYKLRMKNSNLKFNSFFNSYSSDSDDTVYDDELDFNNCPSVHSQSSINCTPIPVHIKRKSCDTTPSKKTEENSKLNYNKTKKRKKYEKNVKKYNSENQSNTQDEASYNLTPKYSRYLKKENYNVKKEAPKQKNEYEISTPEVTKRQARGEAKYGFADQNIDSNITSYIDSLFGVEPYKYVHEHQPLKMFWLHNSEISGLMMVPSLSSLNDENSKEDKVYMVFTDYSIDILQEVTSLNMVTPREGYTPFVVIYSYNLKSMYFKVVKNKVDDVSMVSFNKKCKDLKDCLTKHNEENEDEEGTKYEFYRSYLYGKDEQIEPRRVRVLVHPSNKTNFDMRYLSINSINSNGVQSARSNNSNRNGVNLKGTYKEEEFEEKKEQLYEDELDENKEYEDEDDEKESTESESPFSYTCQNNEEMDMPDELFEECKVLVGVGSSGKNTGHPDSVANYRTESVIKKNFTIYTGVDEEPLSKEVLKNLVKVKNQDKVIYKSEELEFLEGQNLKITFPTIYTKHFENDYITLYSDKTLKAAFNLIKSLQPEDCLNININKLAQFCPNIFWNLALTGDIESSIIELDPEVLNSLYKRRRTQISEQEGYQTNKSKNTTNSLSYLDNNFIMMQNLFKRDADEKIKKLRQMEHFNGSGGRMNRVVVNKHAEDEDIVKTLIDENGFTRKSMRVLTEKQKNIVYRECMKRNFYVPVNIKFNPQKGRGVYAAYKIQKEDFLMEYKGELITEKVAKFRNNKYNKSKRYKGSFIFFFKHNGTRYGIDATEEDISFGPARLVNHSRRKANIMPKTMLSNNYPRLIFIAKRDIECGEELLVDYGERDPKVISENPWLMD